MKKVVICAVLAALTVPAAAQKTIELKTPQLKKGKPVMTALSERKSTRAFDAKELDLQTLSDLLWAADGVNRPDGKRTAPSAMNKQEIDVYACLKTGAYFYNAQENKLERVSEKDCRLLNAPVTLFITANAKPEDKYADIDAGIVAQNVSVFAAGFDLGTVVRGTMPSEKEIRETLGLKEGQLLKLNMPVGYPAK